MELIEQYRNEMAVQAAPRIIYTFFRIDLEGV
jgi:hypothetical protein